jgi:hypothetical protein
MLQQMVIMKQKEMQIQLIKTKMLQYLKLIVTIFQFSKMIQFIGTQIHINFKDRYLKVLLKMIEEILKNKKMEILI